MICEKIVGLGVGGKSTCLEHTFSQVGGAQVVASAPSRMVPFGSSSSSRCCTDPYACELLSGRAARLRARDTLLCRWLLHVCVYISSNKKANNHKQRSVHLHGHTRNHIA